ncbi:hypothetical protein D3C87_1631230 [compost metagenome]
MLAAEFVMLTLLPVVPLTIAPDNGNCQLVPPTASEVKTFPAPSVPSVMVTWPVVLSTFVLRPGVDASTSRLELGSMVVGLVPVFTWANAAEEPKSIAAANSRFCAFMWLQKCFIAFM